MIDTSLKQITLDERIFYYKIMSRDGEYGVWYWTDFYHTNDKTKFVKKYWLWGPQVIKFDNDYAFKIDVNVESCKRTKDEVRGLMMRQVELLERCKEIEKGNII